MAEPRQPRVETPRMTAPRRTTLPSSLLACLVLCGPALGAHADSPAPSALQRNGELSRRVWTPEFAQGRGVSAGLALGLRGAARAHLDRPVAPALTFELGERSRLSLLGLPNRGAMLVLQTPLR